MLGQDQRSLKDATGKNFGLELYAAGKKPEGQITEVSYMFVRPGPDTKPVPKVSLVTRVSAFYYTDLFGVKSDRQRINQLGADFESSRKSRSFRQVESKVRCALDRDGYRSGPPSSSMNTIITGTIFFLRNAGF